MPPSLRCLRSASLCLVLLLAAGAAGAQATGTAPTPPPGQAAPGQPAPPKPRALRDPALYQAEVTLSSQSASEREGATARALMQVIVKLTGNPQAPTNSVIRRAMASASSLVADSSTEVGASDSEGNTAIGGVPVFKTTLKLSFDPSAVDALIAAAGLKYWTGVRPKPILWLAIDDGSGPRLVTGQQTAVVKPLALRGLERGLRFLLPSGTPVETAAVASIWNLDSAALAPLTARYQNDAQLVGKIYRSVSGWSAWWVLSQGGVELARWPVTDADPRKVIASGADPAADAIAKRDAVYLDIGPAGDYLVDVVGVDTQAEFVRLMGYLQTLAIVRRLTVVEASAERLRLSLDLGIGLKGFRMLVATGDTLEAVPEPEGDATPASGRVPRFELQSGGGGGASGADE